MNELGFDFKLLSNLLNPHQNEDSDDENRNLEQPAKNHLKPSDLAPKIDDNVKQENRKTELPKEEWEEDFNAEGKDDIHPRNDWKPAPKWEISYRQAVTSSDVFLQMSGKNPSTSSCENMIVKVHLPGEARPNIDLKVLKDRLEVISPRFFLGMPLPHPVNPQLGNAQYDSDTENLIITLVMDREFDFINF